MPTLDRDNDKIKSEGMGWNTSTASLPSLTSSSQRSDCDLADLIGILAESSVVIMKLKKLKLQGFVTKYNLKKKKILLYFLVTI